MFPVRQCLAAVTLLLFVPVVMAKDTPERYMGHYGGAFLTPEWSDYGLRAQVVALGKGRYMAVFFVRSTAGKAQRLEVDGRLKEGVLQFKEVLELEGQLDGKHRIEGQIQEELFTGRFEHAGGAVRFELERERVESPTLGKGPPEGAVVLMDGKGLDHWRRHPEKWCLQPDGSTEVCGSNFVTRQQFGDATYHIEFRPPLMAESRGQSRGNSGIYLMGRYEIQVLDSFGWPPADNRCGGIYKVAAPLTDADAPPLQWQTYDITMRAPRFDEDGVKTEDAIVTVVHNGETIHDHLVLTDVTPGGVSGEEAAKGVLMLQDHSDQVRYRNIWVLPAE